MDENLKKFIKDLSVHDKKSLTQKSLKLAEECGELAKAVLPYENAYATTHRFIKREKILEEVVDNLLVAESIAYSLNFSDEEIEEMKKQKALKWSYLQAAEDNLKYPVPFEIHITVELGDLDKFKKDCKSLSIKPVLLDLHLKNNGIMKDLMTSSIFHGDNAGVYNEMKRISKELTSFGYSVVREKIETVPWHPASPSKKYDRKEMPKDCYFESHVAVLIDKTNQIERLHYICEHYGAHLSKNVFKRFEDESYIIMATLRSYSGTIEKFNMKLEEFVDSISDYYEIGKKIVEFSIYDSKISHDAAWILNEENPNK